MIGTFENMLNDDISSAVFGYLVIAGCMAGTATSYGSLDGRAGNSPLCWISVVWNTILTLVWLALSILGLTMG